MSKGQDTILTLAEKYGLQNGKDQDYYQCHSTWCITKTGSEKIRQAESITHSFPVPVVTNCSIAYLATFKSKDGEEVHEVGSCRWDGTANNPSKTHSHEMALKRLKVRGILALVAPAGQVYGTDELTSEYKQYGNQANGMSDQQQAPQQAVQQHQAQSQQPAHNAPQNAPQQVSASGFEIPPQGSTGWVQNGEELPTDWSNLMGVLCEITGEDRGKHERNLFDHITQWKKPDGALYLPSAKWSTFGEYAIGFKEWEGNKKWNAYGAMKALHRAKDFVSSLKNNGSIECSQSNGRGGLQSYTIYTKQNNPAFQAGGNAELMQEYGDVVEASNNEVEVPF